jgi:adenylate cyclase class 2
LEIEADSREDVVQVTGLLGFAEPQLTGENTTKVYARYGIELGGMREVRFE